MFHSALDSFYLFIFWLLWLEFSIQCWIIMVRVSILVLFLIFQETFSFSLLNMILAMSLPYMALIMLIYVPSVPTFCRLFILKGIEFCQKPLLHLLRWSYGYYSSTKKFSYSLFICVLVDTHGICIAAWSIHVAKMALFHTISWLGDVLVYVCTTCFLIIHLSRDILIPSESSIL